MTLKINSTAVQTRDVTLAGGANQQVAFTVSENTAGTYAVDVNGLTGSFKVRTAVVAPTVATNDATNITINSAKLNGDLTVLGSASTANVSFLWGHNLRESNQRDHTGRGKDRYRDILLQPDWLESRYHLLFQGESRGRRYELW